MNPLYITGITIDGKFLVGGIFKMKAQVGFPMDMSYEICREHGQAIDYCELLCDAWLSDCLGFDSVCSELDMLGGSHVDEWKTDGAVWIAFNPEAKKSENPVDEFCKAMLDKKREASKAFTGWASEISKLAEALKAQTA